MITKKKLILILVFALSAISVLRLLKISIITSFYPFPLPTAAQIRVGTPFVGSISSKEYWFLSNLVSLRAPCNLLVFGFEQQYLNLSRINAGGNTVILEDNQDKLASTKTDYNDTRIHRVKYQTFAGDAFKLLKHARQNSDCGILQHGLLQKSRCPLALTRLPKEVYQRKWDVVVVDGPRGDTPDAPGRMAAIYTASVIARAGNMTDVVVHDVDRMIEKWFAWEFLCDNNLVSSKGKLWNFRIEGNSNSTTFCPAKTVTVQY